MTANDGRKDPDAIADEAAEESFPGSDPPATWAGADQPFMPDLPEEPADPEDDAELPR